MSISVSMDGAPSSMALLRQAIAGTPGAPFTAELRTIGGTPVVLGELALRPISYSAQATGGPDIATVQVIGTLPALWGTLGWLKYGMTIRNPDGQAVWDGIVEAVQVDLPHMSVGLSLEGMYNKVAVQYTRANVATDYESLITDWASDADSVSTYGERAVTLSLDDGTLAQAVSRRNTFLAAAKAPAPTVTLESGAELGATLKCIGRWYLLDWTYYLHDAGYQNSMGETTAVQPLGFSLTAANAIGFYSDGIHDIDMRLSLYPENSVIRVAGSVSSNGDYTVTSVPDTTMANQISQTRTDISFEALDDVKTGLIHWTIYTVGEMVFITGGAANINKTPHWVNNLVPADRMEVNPKDIINEAAGSSITIRQGHHVTVAGTSFTTEKPTAGASVTLSSHTKIAQKIVATATLNAQDISVNIDKVGTPADTLRVSLFSDVAGSPGVSLGTGTIDPAYVGDTVNWVECRLTTPVAIASGSTYWLVLERTGAVSAVNFWGVGVSDALATGQQAKLWNGTAWVTHQLLVDIPHQIWSTTDTATMAELILTGAAGVTSIVRPATTSVRVKTYRDGTKRRRDELNDLMLAGDASARLLAWLEPDGVAVIDMEPAKGDDLLLYPDGKVLMHPAADLGLGVLPVRRWLRITDLPPGETFDALSTLFVERAAYNVEEGALFLEPKSPLDIWE